jgi:protein-tyrosine phosphatase
MPLQRTSLADADPDKLRSEVVAALQRGELCVLPTETVYGVAALPSHDGAAERLRRFGGRDPAQPLTFHVADADDVRKLGARLHRGAERLIERYWPGPLTLIVATEGDGGSVGVRLPSHAFTRAVVRACGEPLWLTGVPRDGAALVDPDAVAAACGDDATQMVDDGPSPIGSASTIVRADAGELQVLREGILSRDEVLNTAADLILFVCTGNTCRSPLAEAFARQLTAKAMGVPEDRVLARGLRFASAGTATMPGMAASDGSLEAGAEVGLDLGQHLSQPIDPMLWTRAEKIYCLGDSHRRALLAEAPEVGDRVELLRPDGLDIADPYGGDLMVYRRARDEIAAAVQARMTDWWP